MYKKILVCILLVLCFNIVGCSDFLKEQEVLLGMQGDLGVLVWPETELTVMIPKPESATGKIEKLSNDEFAVYVGDISAEYFEKYATNCISLGYNENFSYDQKTFKGENAKGYSLYMRYSNNVMYIRIQTPKAVNDDNDNQNGSSDKNQTSSTYRLGMGIVVDLGHSAMQNMVQVDSTVATVVLDKDGKIVACRIDALQNKASIDYEGYITHSNGVSKADLKEKYLMATYGQSNDWNGDGIVLEWYLQARAFEEYVVGKTSTEVENMLLQRLDNGYIISSDEALLSAGCTIQVTEFIDAVVKACNDSQSMEFTTSEEFTLGVSIKGYLDSGSINADNGSNGEAKLYSDYASTVVVQGKIVAALNDSIQPRVTFSVEGEYREFMYYGTKRELKEDYGMSQAANWGLDQNGDGIVLEWYLQSAEFSKYVVGKTKEEVLAIPLQTISNGYIISADEALLSAGCTIQITGMQKVVAASVANAR